MKFLKIFAILVIFLMPCPFFAIEGTFFENGHMWAYLRDSDVTVEVFHDPISNKVDTSIRQKYYYNEIPQPDSSGENEYTYDLEILKKTSERYYVRFYYVLCDNYMDYGKIAGEGWIDKRLLEVCPMDYQDSNGEWYVKLLEEPRSDAMYQQIYNQNLFGRVTLLDYTSDGKFAYVSFSVDSISYCGWIDRYCYNLYCTSCYRGQ